MPTFRTITLHKASAMCLSCLQKAEGVKEEGDQEGYSFWRSVALMPLGTKARWLPGKGCWHVAENCPARSEKALADLIRDQVYDEVVAADGDPF